MTPRKFTPSKSGFSPLELSLIFMGGIALLAAHTVLTAIHSDAESLVRLVTIVAAVAGVGVHNGKQLSTIKRQTNGELTRADPHRRARRVGRDIARRRQDHVACLTMGFLKDVKVNAIGVEAAKAAEAGRVVFAPRLNFPATQGGLSGEVVDWSLMVQAIEEAGWRLDQWSVAMDTKGRPEAYPIFRRA